MKAFPTRILFLDFDGVIRLIPSLQDDPRLIIPAPEFDQGRMALLAMWCIMNDVYIVVSSDLRMVNEVEGTDNQEEVWKWLSPTIHPNRIHVDWCIPIRGHRWQEVQRWLEDHPEVTDYTILEDMQTHFEDAPEEMKKRISWCNNRHGLMPSNLIEMDRIFGFKSVLDPKVFSAQENPALGDAGY